MSTPSQCLKITQYTLMPNTVIWPHLHPHIHVHTHACVCAHTRTVHILCTFLLFKRNPIF